MGQFDEEIETALELISENGQLVTWRKPISTDDAAHPYKANSSTPQYLDFKKVPICFVSASNNQWRKLLAYLKGTEVPTGFIGGLMAGKSAAKFKPELTDIVLRGTEILRITDIDLLSPNGQAILYTIEFQR